VIIRADYALLAPGVARRDVRLEVDGPRIVQVRSGFALERVRPDYDCGLAVLTPGLVDPHAHLELQFCAGRTPYRGSFFDWLQRVFKLKQRHGGVTAFPRKSLSALAAAGCTTVVDHHSHALNWPAIRRAGLRYYPLREFFEFDNHRPKLTELRKKAHWGYAAHAPYTASAQVARACRRLSDEAGRPLSIHLAEVPGELRFIKTGDDAEIIAMLAERGIYDRRFKGTGLSPVGYCAKLGLLTRTTYAIHVNYCADGDLELLSDLKPTVVFCPRSHAFFDHPAHPLPRYLNAGVPVALGTDSLASNDRLSPLYEAALVRREYPQVAAADVFSAITAAALTPLGMARQLGRLEPGCLADLAVFRLPGRPKSDDFASLLDAVISVGQSALTICDGKVIHEDDR